MSDTLIVIPARFNSTRFPGKVLAKIAGRSVLARCIAAARRAKLGEVLVATDDARVAREASALGAHAALTSKRCVSGTDRVHQAARSRGARYVINLQGDEPLIGAATLRAVSKLLKKGARMATAVVPLHDDAEFQSRNVVKATLDKDGRALYFSRAPIPHGTPAPRYRHIGIYGFRRETLNAFVKLRPSQLERAESLEQLRALENGIAIHAAVVNDRAVAIDVPSDIKKAEEALRD